MVSVGCSNISKESEESLDTQLNVHSCLESINNNDLDKALKICSRVIEKFPNSPIPHGDRSLIYIVKGENDLACIDAQNALNMVNVQIDDIDPLIEYQIKIRHASCKKR